MPEVRGTLLAGGALAVAAPAAAAAVASRELKSEARGRVVIVGGGTAGLTVAARLARKLRHPEITVIEQTLIHI
ncbi:MAG: tryptophan 7-halogenase [Rubrobacteraceae bacterium]|nr:tryptophan 7-halogenase [Rubrobacteraceae bacterium]